jgi:hypothetical protein
MAMESGGEKVACDMAEANPSCGGRRLSRSIALRADRAPIRRFSFVA